MYRVVTEERAFGKLQPASDDAIKLGCICPVSMRGERNDGRYISPICCVHTREILSPDDVESVVFDVQTDEE